MTNPSLAQFVIVTDLDPSVEWPVELRELLQTIGDVKCFSRQEWKVEFETSQIPADVLFVEGAVERRWGRVILSVISEAKSINQESSWVEQMTMGIVDDVLITPIRPLEVMGKLRLHRQIMLWDEVVRMNQTFSGVLERIHEDLRLAERLQKKKLPERFPNIKGFKIQSRYLAGGRSGGDFFDLAEAKKDVAAAGQLSLVLTDSSSYGLANSVLSTLMRVALKLSSDEARSAHEVVEKISSELVAVLGDKDRFSLFYGIVQKKDYSFRYTCLGTPQLYYSKSGEKFIRHQGHGTVLGKSNLLGKIEFKEESMKLGAEDRILLLSDGFLEAIGSQVELEKILNEKKSEDSKTILNELVFRTKQTFSEEELPPQDCTAVAIEVDSKIIRLAG